MTYLKMINLQVILKMFSLLIPLIIQSVSSGWIDPDTPEEAYTIHSLNIYQPRNRSMPARTAKRHPGKMFHLVFSDEFNLPNRTFDDGDDPKWTAMDKNDYTNDALHYYDPKNIRTNEEGELEIRSTAEHTDVIGFDDVNLKNTRIKKYFKSGMLQSWNKFCYTGGILEAEVILPGFSDVGGLWPALWVLGNLARHTYVGSSQHIWPWSSTECNEHTYKAQLINSCRKVNHYDLKAGVGRGAPEIDIFEVQPGPVGPGKGVFWQMTVGQPFMSSSYQVAPGKSGYRPGDAWWPAPGQWYDNLNHGRDTCINILFYGSFNSFLGETDPDKSYWSDALSYNRQLGRDYFERPHKYRLEWGLPDENKTAEGSDRGYLNWFLDDELLFSINGTSIEGAGYGAEISSEPSSIILNTAISQQWGFPKCPDGCPCELMDCKSHKFEEKCGLPPGFCFMLDKDEPKYRINWIRVYQDKDNEQQKVGCSTPERPTKRFIEVREHLYKKEDDEHPLHKIQKGRGPCKHSEERNKNGPDNCGGSERGTCTYGNVCECEEDWTGPNCLVPVSFNDIEYDADDTWRDIKIAPPSNFSVSLLIIFSGTFMVLMIVSTWRRLKFDGYEPVENIALVGA